MRSPRGIVSIVLVAYLLMAGVITYGIVQVRHILAPSKPVAAVTALDATAQAAQQAQQAAKQAGEYKIKADSEERAIRDRNEQETASFVAGVGMALADEPTPSANVQIAALLNSQAARSLPPPTLEALQQITAIVGQLREQNKGLRGKMLTMTDAYTAKSNEAEAATLAVAHQRQRADDATASLTATNAKAAELSRQVVADADSLKSWADDHETLLSRIKAMGMLLLVVAAIGVYVEIKRRGFSGALSDVVAEKNHIEGLIAQHAPEAEAKIKAGVDAWWDVAKDKTSQKTMALVADIKSKLRL